MNAPRSSEAPLLVFDRVEKIYGEGDTRVRAIAGASFTVRHGEFVAIMGASGSGKSTVLNILGALDVPTRGSYRFMGVAVEALARRQRTLLRQHYFGFIFQGFNLLKRTSALENVELPLIYRRVGACVRRARAREALRLVGLDHRERHTAHELSGGQQQRVAIARALVSNPQVILADEPTGNLDMTSSHGIMALLSDLNRHHGVTIVLVTHEDDVAAYASRHLRFQDGLIMHDSLPAKATGT